MPACAPLPDTGAPPAAKPNISFSATAVASSLQLEMSSNFAITKIGAVIRLAAEAAPTKAETEASAGYVSLDITAGGTRKFSISQHYESDFTDGLTPADVLIPNTAYKLYLFTPSAIDLEQTTITGGAIKGDTVKISFTTASLPAAGDAVWSEKWTDRQYVASLNEYHFMQEQTGLQVSYFKLPITLLFLEVSRQPNKDSPTFTTMGTYNNGSVTPGGSFYFDYGSIPGYTSDYAYFIVADKLSGIRNKAQATFTDNLGNNTVFQVSVTRH
ncbi:hypothetical protein P0082_07010 [Candidatus Haliotispira prima]|uniref:DUF4382 domain-containing protein n=1 Tax=Candidatus Haliotispira prima TaxID=3034016 RepID=A0ABY8MEG2_9SPIO|nr:hypothetical protein P0082_07010 [Candidatus Haliotispira prima]